MLPSTLSLFAQACRTRKVKCSGIEEGHEACSRCQHLALTCEFKMPIRRPAPSSTVEDLRDRIRYLEEQLRSAGIDAGDDDSHLSPSPDDDDQTEQSDVQQHHTMGAFIPTHISVDKSKDQLNLVHSFSHSCEVAPTSNDADNDSPSGASAAAATSTSNSSPSQHQPQQDPGNVYSFLGSSSALFPLTMTKQVPQTLKAAAQAKSIKKLVRLEFWELEPSTLKKLDDKLAQDTHAFWPDEEMARNLIDTYFDQLAHRHPLGFDRDDVWRQYNEDPSQVSSDVMLGRMYAIFSLAAWHANAALDLVNNRLHLAGLQWYLASRKVVTMDSQVPAPLSHPLAIAQTLILQACFAMTHPPFIGVAFRLAGGALGVMQDIGGHRQTIMKQLGAQGHGPQERTLTFWTCYSIEKTLVTMGGRPSCLWSEWVDASLPDEESSLWMEAQVALLTEKVLKAKYAAKRPPPKVTAEQLKQIDTQIAFLTTEFEKRKEAMGPATRANVQMSIDGIHLLLHQPELLVKNRGDNGDGHNGGGISPTTMATCTRAIRSIISAVADLDVGSLSESCIGHTCRAAVLAHVLSQSERAEVREAFGGQMKAATSAIIRKGESRWMISGKLMDLLSLPSSEEEAREIKNWPRRSISGRQKSLLQEQQQQQQEQAAAVTGQPKYYSMGLPLSTSPTGSSVPSAPTAASNSFSNPFADLLPSATTPSAFSGSHGSMVTSPQREVGAWPTGATPASATSGSMSAASGSESFDSYAAGPKANEASNDAWTVLFPTLGQLEWPITSSGPLQQQGQQPQYQQQQQQAVGGMTPFFSSSGMTPAQQQQGTPGFHSDGSGNSSSQSPSSGSGSGYSPENAATLLFNFDFGATTAGWF
ncbi:hypothetical protein BDZ90DRAFT_51456 [Jaminaea rosea]|uniref:Xylanolytic transcriptional activator regulatory domain-containing protein n=1 Tax=Jaminaea rosea TaxID=1569628 RepID=A0A316UNC4_9BASI|nr:hypothetical protein BDZ90DRAFT_51456 [Jaminaea rosea]PWN26298.1 hypothetical protein BDZ90DRAFT_51456 [Jaminaea rosea]